MFTSKLSIALVALPLILAHSVAEAAPAQPLRMMNVQGTITKQTASYSPIEVKSEEVCKFSGQAPVYGDLAKDASAELAKLTLCETEVRGKKAQIDFHVSAHVTAKPKLGEAAKTATGILTIYEKGQSPNYTSGSAGSSDRAVSGLNVFFTSAIFAAPEVQKEEVFSVSASFTEIQ